MERVEEFTMDGKSFIYLDFSGVSANNEFQEITEHFKKAISKYPLNSLYTITNVSDVRFDSESKAILAEYMSFNKPYVKRAVVVGVDGIKKIMGNAICKLVGRPTMYYTINKEAAIEWLLSQE